MRYLIDASITASNLEEFQKNFETPSNKLVLSNLTYEELERMVEYRCTPETHRFVRHLKKYFSRNIDSTELVILEQNDATKNKHIDKLLVEYAKENNMTILTCDNGMALWCRFMQVDYKLLEINKKNLFPFIQEINNNKFINLYDGSIGSGENIYVYTSMKKFKRPTDNGLIYLDPNDTLLVASSQANACCIRAYLVKQDKTLVNVSKNIYSSIDDIDNPLHKPLFIKWSRFN